jgi:hypothetical protein
LADERFGLPLAAGDFNAEKTADLVVGVPFKDVNGQTNAGVVTVFYGSASLNRLTSTRQIWTLANPDVPGAPEPDDNFGLSLY